MFKRNIAVLIIHGFAGGTYDEENLANYLELYRKFDVYQFTLPGHDKNLSSVKYNEWIDYSEEKLKWLINNGYKKIYLIGHSMGGVIATYLASKYNEVKKLLLAAPAFQYLKTPDGSKNIVKIAPHLVKTYGGGELLSRFLKLNISTTKEFTILVEKYNSFVKELKCPLLILQGTNDDVVPISSSKYVYENSKSSCKKLVFVDDGTHALFKSKKDDLIFNIVLKFFKEKHFESGIYNI